jgi:predicted enzyme related to lactoylglutathione lyase
MELSHIEHLGIAVKSLEEAIPYYENVLGLKCYNIEEGSELERVWFEGAERVGICGATSTPRWLMEQVAEEVKRLNL